jgi:hypothetical protein
VGYPNDAHSPILPGQMFDISVLWMKPSFIFLSYGSFHLMIKQALTNSVRDVWEALRRIFMP